MKLPTGGNRVQLLRVARERFVFCLEFFLKTWRNRKVSRPGLIPGPTVIVRMKENGTACVLLRESICVLGAVPSFALFTQTGLHL